MNTITYTQSMAIEASNLVSYMVYNSIGEERELNSKTIFSYEGVDLVVLGEEARFCHLVGIAQEITPFTQKRAR